MYVEIFFDIFCEFYQVAEKSSFHNTRSRVLQIFESPDEQAAYPCMCILKDNHNALVHRFLKPSSYLQTDRDHTANWQGAMHF